MSPTTYKDSGVDLELYEQAMQRLPKLMHRTFSPRVIRNDGGFAGLFTDLVLKKMRVVFAITPTSELGSKVSDRYLARCRRTVRSEAVLSSGMSITVASSTRTRVRY